MKSLGAVMVLLAAVAVVAAARGGHELPVYPSFYPHEIDIETIAPDEAAGLLRDGKVQAYIGSGARFAGALPASIAAVDSLGAFVIVRVNPKSPRAQDAASACAIIRAVVRDLAARSGGDFVFHPYPVTPFHGDYLHHVDLAEAAKAALLGEEVAPASRDLKVEGSGAAAELVRPDWRTKDGDWDAAIEEVDAASLVASATQSINGWVGPPWVRSGWFQAALLLADADSLISPIDAELRRLETRGYAETVERINLERQVVRSLAMGCGKRVAGYTVKREFVSIDYTAGIENIGYDAIEGLQSPMFVRTAKLKDFPWNGWLRLGIATPPAAAWNPIAGFTDPFGRLMWSALGDPAVLPQPYDAGWMLNRIADVRSTAGK